jgi:hypothetical protein
VKLLDAHLPGEVAYGGLAISRKQNQSLDAVARTQMVEKTAAVGRGAS